MRIVIALLAVSITTVTAAAEPVKGPVIKDYGPVYYVPDEPIDVTGDLPLKAVFDVAAAPKETGEKNYRLETVARYLNMHVRAGLEITQLPTAVVLHGRALRSALNEEGYGARYEGPNPDTELLRQLMAAGVRVLVCGQSAAAMEVGQEELAAGIEMSLSAMTALVRLQSDGYALIPWGTD